MRTHPLWNPFQTPSLEAINAARAKLGIWKPSLVEVVAPDPAWPQSYGVVCDRVAAALGDRVLAIEHVGSTAVPGLWAKPMIDVDHHRRRLRRRGRLAARSGFGGLCVEGPRA